MAQTPWPGDEQSNWTPQARVRECRKGLKLGTTHKKQEGQEVYLLISVQPPTCSFLGTPHSFPRLCPWQLLVTDTKLRGCRSS